jgi:hypothetical protein
MAITDALNSEYAEKQKQDASFEIIRDIQAARDWFINLLNKKDQYVASGYFDDVPDEIKIPMNRCFGILETAKDAIAADAEIMEILNWRPPAP